MKHLSNQLCRKYLLVLSLFLALFCSCFPLGTIAVAATATVTIVGSGAGTVNSVPSGIACASGSSSGCSAFFADLTATTLVATPDWKSLFGGWSGSCSGNSSCGFLVNTDSTVTATFNPNYQAKVDGMSIVEYTTLAETYANTANNGEFVAHTYTFKESLALNRAVYVTFFGGREGSDYLTRSGGYTTLQGSLDIQQGTLEVNSLIIQ